MFDSDTRQRDKLMGFILEHWPPSSVCQVYLEERDTKQRLRAATHSSERDDPSRFVATRQYAHLGMGNLCGSSQKSSVDVDQKARVAVVSPWFLDFSLVCCV